MTMKIVLLVLLAQAFAPVYCDSSRSSKQTNGTRQSEVVPRSREWRAATYLELTVGKSTLADMSRVLGKPNWSGPPADQTNNEPNPEVWNEYHRGGELPGKLTVITDKGSGVIQGIDLYPEGLSKADAVKHFGNDYLSTRYEFDKCLGGEESAPMYESPDGTLLYLEYRDRGLAIAVDGQGKVSHISYVSKPIGAASSRCKTQ